MAALLKIFDRSLYILLLASFITFLYAIFSILKFSGDKLNTQFYYVIPIIFPFIGFVLNRASMFRNKVFVQKTVDFLVIITAMWRVIGDVPFVSGHSLFLTYAILTCQNSLVRIMAGIVMVEVVYLKVFIWNDWLTLVNGMILGVIAALISNQFHRFEKKSTFVAR